MNWLSIWLATLLREPPMVEYADDRALMHAQDRQRSQQARLELLELEAETYWRRTSATRREQHGPDR